MPCRLLVKNSNNHYSTGDVVCVVDGSHVFGRYESKIEFDKAGLVDWPRQFVIVNITDAEQEDYQYLLEDDSNDNRRYYLTQQTEESPFYQDLVDYAEVTAPKISVDSLIIDRGA